MTRVRASLQWVTLATVLCVSGIGTSHAEGYQSFLDPASEKWWPGADLWGTALYTIQTYQEKHEVENSAQAGLPGDRRPHRLELDTEGDEDGFTGEGPSALDIAIGEALGPYISPIANRNLSKACLQASEAYVYSIRRRLWAMQMFDATGKLPDGIMEGNINAFGNWDECLNITATINATDIHGQQPVVEEFSGKYCYTYIGHLGDKPRQPETAHVLQRNHKLDVVPILPYLQGQQLVYAICMPSVCSAEELMGGAYVAFQGKYYLFTSEDLCVTKDESTTFSSGTIVMIAILALCGLFMVVGTLIDVVDTYAREAPESFWSTVNAMLNRCSTPTLRRVFRSFSVYTNGRKLLDTSSTGDTLNCLHGIRFLSNTWVILGHTYLFAGMMKPRNITSILSFFDSVAFQAVDNATVSVDSFFMLSGLLVAYGFMRQMEKTRGKFNIIMFYVHRYIRLTPVMMLVIGFLATLCVHLGSGPGWIDYNQHGSPELCRKYWWTNLLYVNNFVHSRGQCLGQTWYLANDMQMFVFSPLVLLPLWYCPKLGQLWIILLVCFFTGINAMITAVHKIGLPGGEDQNLRYTKPWCRAGAYLVGIYTGWILFKIRGKRVYMPSPIVAIGWVTSALTACLIVYGVYRLPSPPPKAENIIYPMLNRTAWCICLAWVIFACVTGYAGVINRILSWKAFIPLSRLTYTSYLVHMDIQKYFWKTNKMPLYLDQTFIVYHFLGSLPVIFGVSAVFSLAFESPVIALEKIIFPQPASAPKPRVEEPPQSPPGPRSSGVVNQTFEGDNSDKVAPMSASHEGKHLTA